MTWRSIWEPFCKEKYQIMTTTTNCVRLSTCKCANVHTGQWKGKETKPRDTFAPTPQQLIKQRCFILLWNFLAGSGYGYQSSHRKPEGHEMKLYGLSSWVDLFHLVASKQNRTNSVHTVHLLSHCEIIWKISKFDGLQTQLDCTPRVSHLHLHNQGLDT